MTSCKYKSIGCDVQLIRKIMGAHEQDDKAHIHQALSTVVKLQEDQKKSANAIALLKRGSIVFKVTDYEKKRANNEIVLSRSFYTADGYNMCIEVDTNGDSEGKGTHVSVYERILKGDYDEELNWPFIGTVKFELLNQLDDANHHHVSTNISKENKACIGGTSWGSTMFIPQSKLSRDPVNNTQYLKDNTLYFRVTVELSDRKPWLECTPIEHPFGSTIAQQ